MNQNHEPSPRSAPAATGPPRPAEMTREDYLDRAATAAGGRQMAEAELDVYCPEHGGYRGQDCRCARPGPGQTVKVDARFAAFAL